MALTPSHAPIALFVYKRPEHLRQTLAALRSNAEAEKTTLYVFADGPKSAADAAAVSEVRELCAQIKGFAEVKVSTRTDNAGLARSVVDGVTQVVNQHGRVIVVEDDILVSPYFLRYMNDALEMFADDDQVAGVHGYMYPVTSVMPETFFLRGADCWGWGTWARSWRHFEADAAKLLDGLKSQDLVTAFDRNGACAFSQMLVDQSCGLVDSWAIRWHASNFLAGRFTLYPARSLVRNIGNDGTGTHAGVSDARAYDAHLSAGPVAVSRIAIEETTQASLAIEHYFNTLKPMTQPWHRRLRHWIGSKSATKPEAARPAANVLYAYKNFAIELPADHLLPVYQRKHVKYDRFLPHLCKYVEPGSMVIDVGANCGDTLAAMCDANPALQFLCIEPDDSFFTLLEENILRIKAFDQSISIYANKSLVGKTVASASLEGSGGTKHAVLQAQKDSIKSESLDVIMEGLPGVNVRLLKSDVDGFDYDVIDSAEGVIQADQPILFFECHCDHEYQKAGYKRTLAKMHSTGYENWVVFDNFGQAVLQTTSIDQLDHLIEYVWKQNTGEATRTIYYYDFLAFTSKDADLIAKVMAEY